MREDRSRKVPRLFLDRAFTMKGFGPVVTGTLDAGRLAVEDVLTLLPEGRDVRVRRVEVHGEERREAFTGERTSLNLAGVDRGDLRRGQALVPKGALEAASILTAEVSVLPSLAALLPDGARVRVHLGTADVAGRLTRVGGPSDSTGPEKPAFTSGETAFVQIFLESPVAARPGDRFILRRPSPAETLGGGRVLDAGRPRLKRRADAALFSVLGAGDEKALSDLFLLEAGPAGLSAARLGARLGVVSAAAANLLETLAGSGRALKITPALFAHASVAADLAGRAATLFNERRKSGSAAVALGKGEFVSSLAKGLTRLSSAAADGWLATLAAGKAIALEGDRVVAARREGRRPLGRRRVVRREARGALQEGRIRAAEGLRRREGPRDEATGRRGARVAPREVGPPRASLARPRRAPGRRVRGREEAREREGPDARRRGLPRPPRPDAQDAHPAARVLRLEESSREEWGISGRWSRPEVLLDRPLALLLRRVDRVVERRVERHPRRDGLAARPCPA